MIEGDTVLNKVTTGASTTAMARRACLRLLLLAAVFLLGPGANAQEPSLRVSVPNAAVAAVLEVVGGNDVTTAIDPALPATSITIADGQPVDVGSKILLKGQGKARTRYLDDPRNALRLSVNLREALAKARPDKAQVFGKNQETWAKQWGHAVLKWQVALKTSKVAGKKLSDPHGRIYLLEWAGATVVPAAPDSSPAALAKAPPDPSAPTPESYASYVDALVKSLL